SRLTSLICCLTLCLFLYVTSSFFYLFFFYHSSSTHVCPLSLHDALPISRQFCRAWAFQAGPPVKRWPGISTKASRPSSSQASRKAGLGGQQHRTALQPSSFFRICASSRWRLSGMA